MIHYGFTKTAVLAIARGLAKRAAGTGVTVNSVLPGPTFSEGLEEMLKSTADSTGQSIEQAAQAFVEAAMPSSIIRRVATPEEGWPTWWSTPSRRRHPRRPAPHCGSMA